MQVVLIQNIVFKGTRHVAGEIVDIEEGVAKEFLKSDLAAPYAEIENGEPVADVDDPSILEGAEVDESGKPAEDKAEPDEPAEAPAKTAKKSGKAKK